MKFLPEHLTALAELVRPFDTEPTRERYRRRDFPRSEAVKDVDRRYRFDLFYAARGWSAFGDADYTDAHIETALKRVVPAL